MAKFKVNFTRVETYVHEEIVEAKNRDAAIFSVEQNGFEFPDGPKETVDSCEATEIPRLTDAELETLRRWVTRVVFVDEDENGIANICARFKVRDDNEFMDRVGIAFGHEDAKSLICGLVDSFAFPCEDYANDYDDDEVSGFGLLWHYFEASHTLEVKATVRT